MLFLGILRFQVATRTFNLRIRGGFFCCKMEFFFLGFDPNQFTYGSVLSACTALGSPLYGELVYSLALKNGFFSNGYVQAGMINLFTKLCSFEGVSRRFM